MNLVITVVNLRQQQPTATVALAPRFVSVGGHWDLQSEKITVASTSRQAITLDDLSLQVFLDGKDRAASFIGVEEGRYRIRR